MGLLVPSSNTVMEVDFYRHLPATLTVHTGRMYLEDTTVAGESRMLDEYTLPAAKDLATARPHLMVFGCTSGGALRGNAYDAALCQRISGVSGAPTISVIAAVREELQRTGAGQVAIITPYEEDLNLRIRASVEADGLEVVGIYGLGITDNYAIATVTPEEIVAFARDKLVGLRPDTLFVSCTNFRALEALPALRQVFGVSVVTSNQAALAVTRRALGLPP